MKIHTYLFGIFAIALSACSAGNNSGLNISNGSDEMAGFEEGAAVGIFAQNDDTSGDPNLVNDGNSNGSDTGNSSPGSSNNGSNSHVHQSGGQEGIFIVNGRITVSGPPPTLGTGCDGVNISEGSTDNAGRLFLSQQIESCTIRFNRPFYNPVCVASGGSNTYRTGTPLFDPMDNFTIHNVSEDGLDIDVINYICLDLVKPENQSSNNPQINKTLIQNSNTLSPIEYN